MRSTVTSVADKSLAGSPASIAAVGFALAAYPVGVERGWMTRTDALARTLALLRFFWASPQGTMPSATGHKGFCYHFLDMGTGQRAGRPPALRSTLARWAKGITDGSTY